MLDSLAPSAVAPILGAGIPFSTEWGTLLAILLLLAIQTALAYRRGKVEPLPRGGERRPSPVRTSTPQAERAGADAPRGAAQEIPTAAAPSIPGELAPRGEALDSDHGAIPPSPVAEASSTPPRSRAARSSVAVLRRLREPMGAREAFLGAEILWNPPVALREPGNAGR
ncbi:hypothetical protein [Methylacidimicrobium sp. B4]|uniref:hypothetical protein n=1 Tax=Methylacidimicrobium sp. B4 TaxID=2796139 RepID=UPI001A8CC42D|nr:hypothetical protein [Methylacidimicrobium sp. B4]QSR83883.1 hypothetical protein MacB4_06245 [Methylacidimicrobium sp. B4]